MLAVERHKTILQILQLHTSVRTVDLSLELGVTDETIRRDLEKLEKENLLQRTHGGAILPENVVRDRSFDERNIQNIGAKERIARAALKYIEEGDRIFIDASSTALQLVSLLNDQKLTVLTNSHKAATILCQAARVELIITGGVYDRQSQSYTGPATIATLRRYRIDKAIFSGNGIDAQRGISEINEAQAYIKEMVMPRSGTKIYLADHSKLGVASTYFFASCDDIDTLITDSSADHPVMEELSTRGVDVVLAD